MATTPPGASRERSLFCVFLVDIVPAPTAHNCGAMVKVTAVASYFFLAPCIVAVFLSLCLGVFLAPVLFFPFFGPLMAPVHGPSLLESTQHPFRRFGRRVGRAPPPSRVTPCSLAEALAYVRALSGEPLFPKGPPSCRPWVHDLGDRVVFFLTLFPSIVSVHFSAAFFFRISPSPNSLWRCRCFFRFFEGSVGFSEFCEFLGKLCLGRPRGMQKQPSSTCLPRLSQAAPALAEDPPLCGPWDS